MIHPLARCCPIVAAVFCATAAAADVTADQVWGRWTEMFDLMEMSVEVASEERSADSLTVSGLSLSQSGADGASTMTARVDRIVFAEAADGTVAITMPESIPMAFATTEPEGSAVAMIVTARAPGLSLVASGSAEDIVYDLSGPEITLSVGGVVAEGAPQDLSIDAVASQVEGRYRVTSATNTEIESEFTAGSLKVMSSGTPPEPDQGPFSVDVTLADLAGQSEATLVGAALAPRDMASALSQGFRSQTRLRHGNANYTVESTGPDGPMKLTGTAGSGTFGAGVGPDGLNYSTSSTAVTMAVEAQAMPLPDLSVAIAETAFDLSVPVVETEEPQAFGLALRLMGLAPSDTLWNLGDPAGVLPRNPATLVIDLAGTASPLGDVFGSGIQQQPMSAPPGELNSLDIRQLQLSAAGAEFAGTGAFTFDNSDTTTFDGFPKPTGSLDMTLTGGGALIDMLVRMGLLPPDQANGARMMLGMFARPGPSPDSLVSRVEVTPDGQVLANGQRIR